MHNEVDKFLLANKVELPDDGFSDRVMNLLPARSVNKKPLERIWLTICIVGLIVFGNFSDILDIIITDVKAFLITLPLESDVIQWFYILGVPVIAFWMLTAILTHLTISKS